ncbi:hypothetical protein N3K66_002101 [Trichothecium roseum]|uniref:Uncharacterized protein n=1 Tax=Trichothecium roseum TaxID=47278 RepID=A0ACC0V8X4_9HYPO|nr:hypothetical protein N3K66_002101 [Trichothecium roseum]
MAVVSVAVTLSFHVRHRPTDAELRVARPLGAVFWALSVLILCLGLGNYIRTVNRYSQKVAIVQTGWKTQLGLGILGSSIIVASVVLLVLEETDIADTAKITDLVLSWI